MEVRPGISIAQKTQLVLTPRMRQALCMLQAPVIELAEILRECLIDNPFLEEVAGGDEDDTCQGREAPAAAGNERSGESNRRRKPRRGKPATSVFLGDGSPGNDASPFVPIHLLAGNSAVHAAVVEIHLGDGRMVRVGPGIDRQTLVEVLRVLEVRPC